MIEKGRFFLQQKEYTKTIEYCQRALKKNPKNFFAWYNIGLAYEKLCNLDKALESYHKVLALDENFVWALNNVAAVYFAMGKFLKAIDWAKRAKQLDSKIPNPSFIIGNCYYQLDKFEEAVEYYSEAIQKDPKFISAYLQLAYSHGMLGDDETAINYFKKALELSPSSVPITGLARLYYSGGEYEKSLELSKQAIEKSENDPFAWNLLALSYFKLREFRKAWKSYQRMKSIDSGYIIMDPQVFETLKESFRE